MEPLNDRELDDLLRQSPAPPAPDSLARKIKQSQRGSRWRSLCSASIRIPVPLALLLTVAFLSMFAVLLVRLAPQPVDQSRFQPVKRLEPRIIRSVYVP
jgi:hypothetical protein